MNIRSRVLATLMGAVLLLAGCGDDAPSGPDAEAFCTKDTADAGQIPEDSGQWSAYAETYEELAALAPEDIKAETETVAAAIRKVADGSQNFDDIYLESGVSEAFDAYRVWISENCDDEGGYFPGG